MTEHLCPRRQENPGPWSFIPDKDTWRENESGRLTCSYCGSLAPELFMEAVEAGYSVVPTDKNYKAYVNIPRQRSDRYPDMEKVYFMHLSQSQMLRLTDLLNQKKVNFAEPGHFYVLPYFLSRG